MPKTDIQDDIDTGRDDVDTSTDSEDEIDDLESDTSGWDDGEVVDDDSEDDSDADDVASDSEDEDDSDEEDSDEEDGESEDSADSKGKKGKTEDAGDEEDSADSEDAGKGTMSAEERKRYDNEMAQARMAEARARQEAEEARQRASQAAIQKYIDEAGDDAEEKRARENDVREFQLTEQQIALNTQNLQAGVNQALGSIDLFRTGTKAQQEELAAALDDFELMHVVKDKYGRPVQVKADVVQFLQRKADSIKRIASEGAITQGKKKSNERARTMTAPTRAPKKKAQDAGMDAFDAEASRY